MVPSKDNHYFAGYYSDRGSGIGTYQNPGTGRGTHYVTDAGYVLPAMLAALQALPDVGDMTVYSAMDKCTETLTLDGNGATLAGWPRIYNSVDDRTAWYSPEVDDSGLPTSCCAISAEPISSVPVPGKVVGGRPLLFYGYWYGQDEYIDESGALTATLLAIDDFEARTAVARWEAVLALSIDANGGNGGTDVLYRHVASGDFFLLVDGRLAELSGAITPPVRFCYAFAGCTAGEDPSSAAAVNADGTIAAGYAPSADGTIHAQWTRISYEISFAGTENPLPPLYAKASGGGLYRDPECTEPVEEGDALWENVPEKDGCVFVGVFSGEDSSSTRYVTSAGLAAAAFAAISVNEDTEVHCVFDVLCTVTFDDAGGAGGIKRLLYFDHKLYSDIYASVEAQWPLSPLPVRGCYALDGYFDAAGSTRYVTGAGAADSALTSLVSVGMSEDLALFAQWTRKAWRMMLDDAGGTGGAGTVYVAADTVGWTSDDLGQLAITSVPVPVRTGYRFLGYFSGVYAYFDGNGAVAKSFHVGEITEDGMLVAHWAARTDTLSFSTGATSKTVTWGQTIGTLPEVPSAPSALVTFAGWGINGSVISADTVWTWEGDREASPIWKRLNAITLHEVTDWFRLASASLVPIESFDGLNRPHVVCRHYGKANGASFTAARGWLNPTVRYLVVGDVSLALRLGKAFPAPKNTMTGYMMTQAEIETVHGVFPVVTVSGVANEGADAINLFQATVGIAARARPQNMTVGGVAPFSSFPEHVSSCRLSLRCDPVVLEENGLPCASDVVNGIAEATMEAIMPGAQAVPATTAQWTDMGTVTGGADGAFRNVRTIARMELATGR